MSTDAASLSKMTTCYTCRHILSFHKNGGRCTARGCTSLGKGRCCPEFRLDGPAAPTPPRPDPAAVGAALDVITTALEYAASAPGAQAAAAALKTLVTAIPALHDGYTKHPGRLPERLQACLSTATARQGAEVANHDAHRNDPPD